MEAQRRELLSNLPRHQRNGDVYISTFVFFPPLSAQKHSRTNPQFPLRKKSVLYEPISFALVYLLLELRFSILLVLLHCAIQFLLTFPFSFLSTL